MRFVLTIFAFIALTQAIEFNNQRKSALEKAFQPARHPIVLQESSGDDVSSNSTGEEEIVWIGNSTNSLGFEFKNHTPIEDFRTNWNSFLLGMRSDFYSPNISTCLDMSIGVYQYDIELLMIKYMYGDAKQNVLNTTLFLGNVSDMSYICIDAAENLYVYTMYKFDLFGRDKNNVVLGALQNLLGSILTINSLYGQIIEYSEANDTEAMYYEFGRIFRLVVDIEPVVLEEAAFNADEIVYSGSAAPADSGVWGRPLVMQEGDEEEASEEASEEAEENFEDQVHNFTDYDTWDDAYDINNIDINLEDFDWSFGLFSAYPGLGAIFEIGGPFDFFTGFLNGTQFLKDDEVLACENLIEYGYIPNANAIVNMTGTIFQTDDRIENIYNVFDQMLLVTKITQQLHPIAFHCWNGGENVYGHFYDIIAMQNGYNPKTYIMNTVYNFGHIFDNMRDVYLYFTENPRGQINSVHDAGYNLGLAVYFFITPELAYYESDALKYEEDNDEALEENEFLFDE